MKIFSNTEYKQDPYSKQSALRPSLYREPVVSSRISKLYIDASGEVLMAERVITCCFLLTFLQHEINHSKKSFPKLSLNSAAG